MKEEAEKNSPSNLPLSFSQHHFWLLEQLLDQPGAYNMPVASCLEGPLNIEALQASLDAVLQRHAVLRTSYVEIDDEPTQQIRDEARFQIEFSDLSTVPETHRDAAARAALEQHAWARFDLEKGACVRALLVRLKPQTHWLQITLHHICADGWSLGILLSEITALYAFYTGQTQDRPKELKIGYADFAIWQRQQWKAGKMQPGLTYWQNKLRDPPVLVLPADQTRPPIQSYEGGQLSIHLPAPLADALKEFAAREKCSLYMLMMAVFQFLLARYGGQTDIIVGTPVAGRSRPELEGLIGCFVNTVPVRGNLSGNPEFKTFLQEIRKTTLEALTHQDIPFEEIVEAVGVPRDAARPTLVQAMLAFQNTPAGNTTQSDLKISSIEFDEIPVRFDLEIHLWETDDGMAGNFLYNGSVFTDAEARNLEHLYGVLLTEIVENPHIALDQCLIPVSVYFSDFVSSSGVVDLLGAVFSDFSECVAVEFGDERLSYGDLWSLSDAVCAHLCTLGVSGGDFVGVRCGGTPDLVVSLLGILKAGAGYLPLDPSYPDARVRFMLEDAPARVVLSDDASSFGSSAFDGLSVTHVDVTDIPVTEVGSGGSVRSVGCDYPAYVIYTSGSTGTPKGVVVPQRAVAALASDDVYLRLGPGDRVAQLSNTSFDAATFEIWSTLLSGATLVLLPRDEVLDADTLPDTLRRHGIDSLFMTTALFNQISRRRPDGFRGLRDVLFGGEAVDPSCVARVVEAGGPSRLLHVYGPTENTTFSTWHEVGAVATGNRTVAIGAPLSHVSCHVLDGHMRPVPYGAVGELYLGGAGLADGYLRRPALTASQFVPNPFGGGPGSRLYRTGDLVRRNDGGALEFVERLDGQVKLRGLRIELGEITAALLDHAGVLDAVAQVLDAGGENARLVAYWVPASGSAVTVAMLRTHLAARLPSYAVPAALVCLEGLPLTSNGKIDHAALPLPTDEHLARPGEGDDAPSGTPLAEVIGHVWSNILDVERVLPSDDFFTLGGHSLLVTRVTSRLRQVLNVEIPVRTLFEAPALTAFADRVEVLRRQAAGTEELVLEPVLRTEPPVLSYAQQRLWFIEQIAPLSPAYYISLALELTGPLQPAALEAALTDLCDRHEALRTGFAATDGEARQQILPSRPVSVEAHDLTARPEALSAELAGFAGKPFDLSAGEVIRAALFALDVDRHALAVSIHHIAADGWSLGILTRELGAFYEARRRGGEARLPPLPIQYADFAVWQRRWLQGEALHRQQTYWRRRLEGLPVLELPADRPRPAQPSYAGGSIRTEIDPILAGRLVALGRTHECTLYMVLLAAYQALLGHYAGQDDIVVGSPVAGRTRTETEGLIGFFVNMLVMRTDLDGDPDFPGLLDRVREGTLEAYAHQDVPFELVVDDIAPDRVANRHPLFQHHFALQTAPVSPPGFSGLEVRPIGADASWVRFDLECHLWHEEDGAIRGAWLYDTDLFDAGTVEQFEKHFCRLLSVWADQPGLPLSRALAPGAEEQARICAAWGRHDRLTVTDNLAQRFARSVLAHPDRTALSTENGTFGYDALDRRANRLAHLLIAHGVRPETRIGLAIGASAEQAADLLIGLLAILKAGGAYVPLDPAYPSDRIAYMARDAGVRLVLTHTDAAGTLPDALPDALDGLQSLNLAAPDTRAQADACPDTDPGIAIDPGHAAYVIYTSGSTGQPKGVVVTHANVLRLMDTCQDRFGFGHDDVWTLFHSYAFDFSVWEIWGAWLHGGRLVTVPYRVSRDPAAFLDLLGREAVTVLNQTPTAFYNLIGALPDKAPDLALRYVIFGGEALEPARLGPWFDRYGDRGPEIVNMYGITETTVHVTWQTITANTARRTALSPIGTPLPDLACHILDRNMIPVDCNVPGEIYVAGAGIARGYLDKPALTAERFVPNPFAETPGERLYKTGDIANRDQDGNINYIRRADSQIQLRGFRIELGEIEAVIAKNKNVQNVAVTTKTTNKITNINAFVVATAPALDAGARKSLVSELRRDTELILPRHMQPASYAIIDEFPLSPSGKLNRGALPDIAPTSESLAEIIAPRSGMEATVLQTWKKVLEIDEFGVTDNFFDLGGHSLTTIRLANELERVFGFPVPISWIFDGPTIEQLVARFQDTDAIDLKPSSIVSLQPEGDQAPWFMIHPLGGTPLAYLDLAHLLGPNLPCYGLQAPGIEDDRAPLGSIEEMAGCYVDEIRTLFPEGPYHLAGYSLGGMVAFEMARLLAESGSVVGNLLIIDSAPYGIFEKSDPDAAPSVSDELAFAAEVLGVQLPDDGKPADRTKELLARGITANTFPVWFDLRRLERLIQVMNSSNSAYRNYEPNEYHGLLTLVLAADNPQWKKYDAREMWEKYCSDVTLRWMKGEHNNVLETPQLSELASIFQDHRP